MEHARLNVIGLRDVYGALNAECYAPNTTVRIEGTSSDTLAQCYRWCADHHKEVLTTGEHWFGGYLKWEVIIHW